MANSVDPDQTAPIGAVCSGSTLFASILNLSVMLGNYLQQTTSADVIFRCIFFLVLLGLKYNATFGKHEMLVLIISLLTITLSNRVQIIFGVYDHICFFIKMYEKQRQNQQERQTGRQTDRHSLMFIDGGTLQIIYFTGSKSAYYLCCTIE